MAYGILVPLGQDSEPAPQVLGLILTTWNTGNPQEEEASLKWGEEGKNEFGTTLPVQNPLYYYIFSCILTSATDDQKIISYSY